MLKRKRLSEKGKFSFRQYFQKFAIGDSVAVVRNLSFPFSYSTRIQGRTGKIVEKRGSSYYIELNDINKPKRYLLRPIHLKRIMNAK